MKAVVVFEKIVAWLAVLFTAVVLAVMFTPVANFMARPLIIKPVLKRADIIAVLGGGAYKNGALGKTSTERLVAGLMLYKQGFSGKIIYSGSAITSDSKKIFRAITKSDESARGVAVEAGLMKNISDGLGIGISDTVVDNSSTNTYQNLSHVKDHMEKAGFKTCLIVTSSTHILRAMLIAKKLGMECYPAPVDDYTEFRLAAADRLGLFYEALWEYAGLVFYKVYGYI